MKTPIFIHIPKTGGTSINCVMKGTPWQTPIDYHYRHLIFETKESNCGDIFDRAKQVEYQNEFIFMMLREPVDRLISEYYYIRKNPDFMQYLTPMPMSFEEYVMNPQTSNYMLKFLDGRRIYDDNSVMTDTRTDEIIGQIDALDIHVGIFEKYALSLSYLDAVGNFQWPDTMEVKRATLNRPNVAQISNSLRSKILEANAQDLRLYNHCLNRLLEKTRQQVVQKIKFKGGRLDFVIPYTMWNCILDVELSDKRFVETNKTFLVTLNHYLHKTVTNGKDYAKQWLKLFNESVAYYYSGSKFLKQLKAIKRPDPLDKIIAIARLIDKAAKDKSLGMDVTEDKLRLRLSKKMAQVLKQDDLTPKGIQKW